MADFDFSKLKNNPPINPKVGCSTHSQNHSSCFLGNSVNRKRVDKKQIPGLGLPPIAKSFYNAC